MFSAYYVRALKKDAQNLAVVKLPFYETTDAEVYDKIIDNYILFWAGKGHTQVTFAIPCSSSIFKPKMFYEELIENLSIKYEDFDYSVSVGKDFEYYDGKAYILLTIDWK